MPRIDQFRQRSRAVGIGDFPGIDGGYGRYRIEQRGSYDERTRRVRRHDRHGNAARKHRAGRDAVRFEVGPGQRLRLVVVPNDPVDPVAEGRIFAQCVADVRQRAEGDEEDLLLLVFERFGDQRLRRGKGGPDGERVAPVHLPGMRPPHRSGRPGRMPRTDRDALVVKSVEQRPHGRGRLGGRQGAFRGGDGEHLHLAVAQQHAERAQVVGRPVGVDDRMEARLARMRINGRDEEKQTRGRQGRTEKNVS